MGQRFDQPITLIGGGAIYADDKAAINALSAPIFAADSGADYALDHAMELSGVFGDFDSISAKARANLPAQKCQFIAEQDSTDFEKSLQNLWAPMIFAFGFTGARIDHLLAVFSALVKFPTHKVLIIGERDIICLCPPKITLNLPIGTRISLYPMGACRAQSHGLKWALDGLDFAPDGQIGTSNAASLDQQTITPDCAKMLLCCPREYFDDVTAALNAAAFWTL